jgi:pilus assembly protein CpaF
MINTAKQVYIERQGKIYLTDVTFMNEQHLLAIIQRIVTRVGRRIDEASPMVDARLPDGSRFNAIIPPLALDGALVSIRKFKEVKIALQDYVNYGTMTPQMARFLEICGNVRLNIIVSGGTGSGKTTMLNAISQFIDHGERVITIEDAAELQLMQPHVLRLETRPASSEGVGEVTQRQLVRNALRMRPDRIILGEIRGDEVIDVLTAMNTGHDGSLATIHSNSPRDCLARIENLVNMSGVRVSDASLRHQISSAVQLIIQLQRMRDGKRRVTHIEEVVGREGETIVTQTLFSYNASGVDTNGQLIGEFRCHGIRPKFLPRAEYFGREKELLDTLEMGAQGRL